MKAMIFAAGLGTRLKPLTDKKPKALLAIGGKSMLEWTIQKLINNGFNEIIINVHHFANQVTEFLNKKKNFRASITLSHENGLLLDTGGGLKKASWFFNDSIPFLLHNVDVLSNINLKDLVSFHVAHDSVLATLVVRNRQSSRYLLFDQDLILSGWVNEATGEEIITRNTGKKLQKFAFSGIQLISPELLSLIDLEGKFSIIDVYLRLSEQHKIIAFPDNNSYWFDLGNAKKLYDAEKFMLKNKIKHT